MKILILGTSCSGKSTLARKLETLLGINHIELDELSWLPNWEMKSNEDFFKDLEVKLQENESWIVCGNYNFEFVRENIWKKADVVIWLNYSLLKTLFRALKRTYKRVLFREKCCNGNTESLRRTFSKDSILVWIWTTHKKRRERYIKLQKEGFFSHARFYEVTNSNEYSQLLKNLT